MPNRCGLKKSSSGSLKTNELASPASRFRNAAGRSPNADIRRAPDPHAGIGSRTRPRSLVGYQHAPLSRLRPIGAPQTIPAQSSVPVLLPQFTARVSRFRDRWVIRKADAERRQRRPFRIFASVVATRYGGVALYRLQPLHISQIRYGAVAVIAVARFLFPFLRATRLIGVDYRCRHCRTPFGHFGVQHHTLRGENRRAWSLGHSQ